MAGAPLDAATAQELIKKLVADREAYLESMNKTHQLLIQTLAQSSNNGPSTAPPIMSTGEAARRNTISTATLDVESVAKDTKSTGSTFTGESDDEDDNESLFVQIPLDQEAYTMDGFRKHLLEYNWTEADLKIMNKALADKASRSKECIFPTVSGPVDDRSHLSHYSIFDVGTDGAPLEIRTPGDDPSRSLAIWNRIKSTNADTSRQRPAVGRIVIVREPSPLLYAALHYCMHKHFDVDELFQLLVDDDPRLAHPHRAFSNDERQQRSFVFTMEYFTIIGEGCKPQEWQLADEGGGTISTHIPITRCSSVIALSLSGKSIGRVRNKDRRVNRKFGDVYDPFAPWRVLSIQAYPDWQHSVDAHDATKHYMNGPEAFLVTLRAEFRDARRRLTAVYDAISELVEPPANFMFHQETRDRLLFEDEHFTYSRRYFWAYQSLGIMNQDIHEMVTTYYETFKDNVWDGSNKIIWPGEPSVSSRHLQWRKRMGGLRQDLEHEVERLRDIEKLNEQKMKEVKGLRDNLFSGTSVFESRQSVENSRITVEQGRNIRLLTLVTIFFLPLTFVTSVFGMTPINPSEGFVHFGYTLVLVCIPTYLIIGSLNTYSGLIWWRKGYHALEKIIARLLARILALFHYHPTWTRRYHVQCPDEAAKLEPITEAGRRPRRPSRMLSTDSADGRGLNRGDTFGGMPQINTRRGHHERANSTEGRSNHPPPPQSPTRTHQHQPRSPDRGHSYPPLPSPTQHTPRSSTIKFGENVFERVDSRGRPAANGTRAEVLKTASPTELSPSPTFEREKMEGASEDTASGAQERGSLLGRLLNRRKNSRSKHADV